MRAISPRHSAPSHDACRLHQHLPFRACGSRIKLAEDSGARTDRQFTQLSKLGQRKAGAATQQAPTRSYRLTRDRSCMHDMDLPRAGPSAKT